MPESGQTILHYTIGEEIGQGGMGEVYQARDRKLGRDVAIKVLPEEFARDAERVARFQREAKLLASLNHPNIAAIHGLEEANGTHFLVMELIEGQTLNDRIKAGPIPVEESLKLALQIAEALEAAHEKGVIHRDLKPANIKVTPDDKVKVLDFGLAKAFAGEQADLNMSNSPTLSHAATMQGVILGTAAYMSPEQARGKEVDKRADVWAFGAVLFEMITEKQVFTGDTVSDTLASVLAREPEWKSLPPNLHPRIRLLLKRCLKKDPKDRYSGISDARVDIKEVLADPGGALLQQEPATISRKKIRVGLPWLTVAVLLSIVAALIAGWHLKRPEPGQVIRFSHELREEMAPRFFTNCFMEISPDGSEFVYSTANGLHLRTMDGLEARLISGTDGPTAHPFFSPDGKWIGYWSLSDSQLKRISVTGGAPEKICDAEAPRRPMWHTDDTIVYSQSEGIMRISANGGTPELIVDSEGVQFWAPQLLPDGKAVLFSYSENVAVQPLESGNRKTLINGSNALYLPTGHLVYGSNGNLYAVPFNLDTLDMEGGPILVVEGIVQMGPPQYSISDSGTLIYMPDTMISTIPQRTLVWVDRKGNEETLPVKPDNYEDPRISPDGTRVAVEIDDNKNQDIWILNLDRDIRTRFTFDEAMDARPCWSPDGKRIIFASNRDGNLSIFWRAVDGTGKVDPLTQASGNLHMPASILKNGKILLTAELLGKDSIGMLSLEGNQEKVMLLQEEFNVSYPEISPDGRWIAYESDEFGQNQIFIRPFPDVQGGKWQITTDGGTGPRWSIDGKEIFYSNGNTLMAVPIETEPVPSQGRPEALFTWPYLEADPYSWDIHPDGDRFLMIKQPQNADEESGDHTRIIVVTNWFEELKDRVPVP